MSWIRSQFASFASKEATTLNNNLQHSTVRWECGTSILSEPTSNLKNFESFWHDASAILCKPFQSSEKPLARASAVDDSEIVIHLTGKMVKLLTDESCTVGCDPQLLDRFYSEEVLDRLLTFSRQRPESHARLISHQLSIYDTLMSHSHQLLLIQAQFTRPLLSLLDDCKNDQIKDEGVEEKLVSVLHQVCVAVTQNPNILDLLVESGIHRSSGSKFFDLSMLVPFAHRTGAIGQQARDDLLLLMSLSSNYDEVSKYITEKTDFCQVLVVSLSGLYSSLPRTLTHGSDDWHSITDEDIAANSDLQMFLNLLEFCSALVQVSHISIQDQLLNFIFSGFLVSVIGPTLHQLDPIAWSRNLSSEFGDALLLLLVQNGIEEAIAVTAYLDLFIRKIAEPRLLQAFLKFILLGKMEDVTVLEALIRRINSPSTRLCVVTLTLFRTLVDLNCEDVMYQLVFKYLLPCTHIMVSQQRSVSDIDVYCKAAEKLTSMISSACLPDNHGDGCCGDERLTATRFQSDSRFFNAITDNSLPPSPSSSLSTFQRSRNWFSFRHRPKVTAEVKGYGDDRDGIHFESGEYSPVSATNNSSCNSSLTSSSRNPDSSGSGYLDYLQQARVSVENCIVACRNWSSFYGCEDPVMPSVLSPTSSAPTAPPSTGASYSDIVRGRGMAAVSETNSSATCDETSGSGSQAVVRPADDLLSFLIQLNRTSLLDGSEASNDIVEEFEQLLDAFKDSVSLEPIAEVDVVLNSPSSGAIGRFADRMSSVDVQDSGSTGVRGWQTVGSEAQNSLRDSRAASRDARPSVIGFNRGHAGNTDTPCVGPFLTEVLNKLESMRQNTLYVNLQLTGLVARLACYPQALLSSLLLSHTLVFQPSVKSLMQVLNTVKCRIEEFLYKVKEKDHLFDQAYSFLQWRVSSCNGTSNDARNSKPTRRHSLMTLGSLKPHLGETRISSVMSRLKVLDGRHGAYYSNRPKKQMSCDVVKETQGMVETKNAIYSAVVFKEFLKELAAISQERALLVLRESS